MLLRWTGLKIGIQSLGWQQGKCGIRNGRATAGKPKSRQETNERRKSIWEAIAEKDQLNLHCGVRVDSEMCRREEASVKVAARAEEGSMGRGSEHFKCPDIRTTECLLGPGDTYLQDLKRFSGHYENTTFLLSFSLVLCGASLIAFFKCMR